MTQKDQNIPPIYIILVGTFTPLGWSKTPPSSQRVTGLRSGTIVVTCGWKVNPKAVYMWRMQVCVTKKKKRWNSWHRHFCWVVAGFKNFCFMFTLENWEDVSPFFDSYFSDGLKPPTSILLVRCFFWLILFLDTLWKVWKSWKRK